MECTNGSMDSQSKVVEDHDRNNQLLVKDEEVKKLQFHTADSAEKFYKTYAAKMGFKVRRSHTSTDQGRVTIRYWECTCAGTKNPLEKGKKRKRKEKPNIRCKCLAKFRISRDSSTGLYNVLMFESPHNHELRVRPSDEEELDNGSLTKADKLLLSVMRNVGIRPCHSINYVQQTKGETGDLLTRKKQMYNYLGKERVQTMKAGDINIAMSVLIGMKLNDPDMLFESTVDNEGKLNRLFWCDGFSRTAFKSFGDILICDSTYKTNTYLFPLVILSGIDNHFKCTIFGVALLQNETIESYEWLFKNLVKAMGEKAPHVVVTDQDEAMRVAIKLAFPNAIHRLCGWHLQRNCVERVKVAGFCHVFGKLIKKRCSGEEFESRWLTETEKHGVTNNSWVKNIYKRKEMWSDAYLRGHFVGMTRTSQRAESMNFVFKQQGKAGSTITELVKHFTNVLKVMRLGFRDLQRASETSPSKMEIDSPLHPLYNSLALVYTKSIMEKVEKEIMKEEAFIVVEKVVDKNGATTFLLEKYGAASSNTWSVSVDVNAGTIICDCNMLEADGLPCRNLFTAFKNMNIQQILAECIRQRWTTEVGRELKVIIVNNSEIVDPQLARFMKLNKECSSLCVKASQSDYDTGKCLEKVKRVARKFLQMKDLELEAVKFRRMKKSQKNKDIHDPKRIPTRGAPPRQPQRCSKCGCVALNS